jgi:DNA-binding NtrC family response regulator
MEEPKVVLLEANVVLRERLQQRLGKQGFGVIRAVDLSSVLQVVVSLQPKVALIGSMGSSPWDQLVVAQQVRQRDKRIGLILLPAHSSEALAIAALKMGVNDYLKPPFGCEEIIESVTRYLSDTSQGYKETRMAEGSPLIIGDSRCMRQIKGYIPKAASAGGNVLITGETGTGKELVAEWIHRSSARWQRPMVCINCAAIPDSLLESELYGYEKGAFSGANAVSEGQLRHANGGTVFLDEIGDMSLSAQAKILRTLESKEIQRLGGKKSISVDIRIIAATNQDLERLVAEHQFRKDLFFRLNVIRIHLPPLREHKEDIPALLDYYLQVFSRKLEHTVNAFAEDALACLLGYHWPGNVRELKNLVEATLINASSPHITLNDLPNAFRMAASGLSPNEKERLLAALIATDWNKSKAAAQLNWSRMTLYRKMEKYHIMRGDQAETGTTSMEEL